MKLLFHIHFECFFSLYEKFLEMGFSFLFETKYVYTTLLSQHLNNKSNLIIYLTCSTTW